MKKVTFLLLLVITCIVSTSQVFAAEVFGDEIIQNGDFEFSTGTEINFPDPVFNADFGVAHNWGSGVWDSYAKAIVDPLDSGNTVMKLSYSVEGKAWSSFFRFTHIESSSIYAISIDFKVVGTTDNLGMRFAGAPALEVVFLNHASKTPIDGKEGWYNVKFDFDTTTGSYDSIAMWFNTGASSDNYALIDNIDIRRNGEGDNIIQGGNFEGFLDYAPQATLDDNPNLYGFFGQNGTVGNGKAILHNNGVLGYTHSLLTGNFVASFNFEIGNINLANIEIAIKQGTTVKSSHKLVDAGVKSEFVTLTSDVYYVNYRFNDAAFDAITISYVGSEVLTLDDLSLKEVISIPNNPFDPDTEYFTGANKIVNGNFEAFPVDTIFTEQQLEGAWGSIALDGPGKIVSLDGSKVLAIGKTAGKSYSSAFVMTPPDLAIGDLIRLSYDYKLVTSNQKNTYTAINSSFVGASNEQYYEIDLRSAEDGSLTTGGELLSMPIKITSLGNGWYNVTLDIQVDAQLLVKTNSIRFLFTPLADNDYFYVDNVSLFPLSDEEFSISITQLVIDQNDQELKVGQKVTLTATISPNEALQLPITWSSSNTSVVTINQSGQIEAVGKGAATIRVQNEDNTVFDEIVVTVLEDIEEANNRVLVYILVPIVVIIFAGGFVFFKVKRKV